MQTVIVIPCLNEAGLIARTALSLGFGAEVVPDPATLLVLVDNGSTDDTWTTLCAIRDRAPSGTVLIAQEETRGYVPPRHRGAIIASEVAARHGLSFHDVLILQGDADTVYEPGYAVAMRQAALAAGSNCILEARTRQPLRFLRDHPGFQELADVVDREMAPYGVGESDDVIVDDKVAGFRLGDYLQWGGHRRDYLSTGAEVHAETTRLYIRARRFGAQKVQVDQAWAMPSRRKIQRNPVRHFATAGFPRENAWWRTWNASYDGPNDLAAFDDPGQRAALEPAIAMRRAHLAALFTAVPLVVAESLGRPISGAMPKDAAWEAALSYITGDQLGRFFEALLPH